MLKHKHKQIINKMLMVLCMDFFNIKIYSNMFIMVNGYYNTMNAENE